MVDFNINIVVNTRGAQRGGREVERSLNRIEQRADRVGEAIRRAFAFLATAAGIGTSVRLLADFGQAMSTVRAITGATEQQFVALSEEAQRLGATTRFTATQAADGLTFLARAGFTADEALGAIEGTLQLAQAGGLGLARAADIASNVLQGFRLDVDQTARVVDVLALAANSSNTNVTQLGDALSFVAPIAAGLGIPVEETTAAIGALSNAGIQASRAGTGLQRILSALVSPTARTRDILRSLGLTVDDVRVSQIGLVETLRRLTEAGLDTELAFEIFQQRGGPAFEVLANSIPDIVELIEQLRNAGGTAQRVADIMDNNLNGALLRVRSASQGLVLAFGEIGASAFLTEFFRSLANTLDFLRGRVDDLVAAIEVLLVALIAVRGPLLAFSAALAILSSPLLLLFGPITLLTSAIVFLRDEINLVADGSVTLRDGLSAAEAVISRNLIVAVNNLGFSFEGIGELFNSFLTDFSRGLIFVLANINGALAVINALFDDFPGVLRATAIRAWNGFLEIAESALDRYVALVRSFVEFVRSGFQTPIAEAQLFEEVEEQAQRSADDIVTIFLRARNEVIRNAVLAGQRRTDLGELEDFLVTGRDVISLLDQFDAAGAPTEETARTTPEFDQFLVDLERSNELLRLNSRERENRIALFEAEDALGRSLTANEAALVEELSNQNIALADQRTLIDSVLRPLEDYQAALAALNGELVQSILTQEQAEQAVRDLQIAFLDTQTDAVSGFERGFLRIQDSVADFASTTEELVGSAFREISSEFQNFITTGEFSFRGFIRSIADSLIQLGTQQLFQGLFNLLPGSQGGGGGFGGIGGFISNLLPFQTGVQGLPVNAVSLAGLPGVDNRLVAFRARSDETIDVNRPGDRQAGFGAVQQVFNIQTTDADSFQRSQTQIQNRGVAALDRARSRR